MGSFSVSLVAFVIAVAAVVALIWLPLNWRRGMTITKRLQIDAPAQKVWELIDLAPGPVDWHPHLRRITCLDGNLDTVRLHHEMHSPGGHSTPWEIDLEIEGRQPGQSFRARRLGLEEFASLDDRLLSVSARIQERNKGCVLTWQEAYGPRSMAGRFMVHSDIDSTLSQLKSYCETGKVCRRSARSAGMALSLLSAIATISAFALLIGWQLALLFAIVLIIHELGHLVSFRMVGQPWGRIMFVPFIGGVAVSRVPHKRLADDVFCALMGAGLSLILLVPAAIVLLSGGSAVSNSTMLQQTAVVCAALAGAINLLNLLPIFPLDGGRVVRAMVQSVAPNHVRHAMFALAGLIAGAAIMLQNALLTAIAVIAFFQSKRLGPAATHIETMTPRSMVTMGCVYAALTAAHAMAFVSFGSSIFG